MINFFKGFIVGIGKIIPGVSGAILAISMGIYDIALDHICNFKKNKKESIKYLFPICLGIILSIIVFSKLISIFLGRYYIITMLFFIGLIIGGIPFITYKVEKKDYYLVIISFIVFFLISVGGLNNVYNIKNNFIDYIVFFLSGIVEAIGTVVPGISSTALLMVFGTYNTIVTSIGNLNNIKVLLAFTLGMIIGLYLIVKIINYLFKNYENKLYAFVLGVLLSSIILLIIQSLKNKFTIIELIIGLIFMVVGIFITNIMKKK